MNPPPLQPAPRRSWFVTLLACAALGVGALGMVISVISLMMLSTARYGQSSTLDFLIVVVGPWVLFAGGLGLLLRRVWGYLIILLLTALFAVSCMVDFTRQPLGPTETVTYSPTGVKTTTFRSGSRGSIFPLGASLALLLVLLLPPVRSEFRGR